MKNRIFLCAALFLPAVILLGVTILALHKVAWYWKSTQAVTGTDTGRQNE